MQVYIQTHGCALNQADSESMKGQLVQAGHDIVENEQDADVIVLNSCTVKNKTDSNFRKTLRGFSKPTVVAGCIPEATPKRADIQEYSLLGTEHISSVVDVVEKTFAGERVVALGKTKEDRISLPTLPSQKQIGIIPISKGCLSTCSYCQTKLARGDLESFGVRRVVERVQRDLDAGASQIWLTSQDCSAYGLDIGTNAGKLLHEICSLDGEFMVRFGMANPLFFKRIGKDLLDAYESEHVYKFLHIPIQSGSNAVLKTMRRGYKVEDFLEIVDAFKQRFPDITIATDIIVGHPGESDEDFAMTLDLLDKVQPQVINFSNFSARPGTDAAHMEFIPQDVVRARMDKLKQQIFKQIANYHKQSIGKTLRVLVEQQKKEGSMLCRTTTYQPVVVQGTHNVGSWIDVTIVDATQFHIVGVKNE